MRNLTIENFSLRAYFRVNDAAASCFNMHSMATAADGFVQLARVESVSIFHVQQRVARRDQLFQPGRLIQKSIRPCRQSLFVFNAARKQYDRDAAAMRQLARALQQRQTALSRQLRVENDQIILLFTLKFLPRRRAVATNVHLPAFEFQ